MTHLLRTTAVLCVACTAVLFGEAQRPRQQQKPPLGPFGMWPAPPSMAPPTSDFPMQVTAAPFRGRGRNAAVAFAVELEAASLGLAEYDGVFRGRVNVRYLATDAKRKVYPEVSHVVSVQIRRGSAGSRVPLEHIRVRVVSELELRAGQYQVQVTAGSAKAAGRSTYDLNIPDFGSEPLVMSGVMLIRPSDPMVLTLNTRTGSGSNVEVSCQPPECKDPAASGDGSISLKPSVSEPQLRGGVYGAPSTAREFKPGTELVVVAEAYDNTRRRKNVSPVVTLTTDLRKADGTTVPLGSSEQRVTTLREDVSGGAFKSYISLPANLPDGEYVLLAQARSNADEKRMVSREIPISIRR